MSHRLLICLLLCTFTATAAIAVAAQDPTGAIEGAVTDQTAASLPGAEVVATHLATGFTRTGMTDDNGYFRLVLLPVGSCAATAMAAVAVNVQRRRQISRRCDIWIWTEVARVLSVRHTASIVRMQ